MSACAEAAVLIVEDDEDSQFLLRTVFEREGARVTVASSVKTALELRERPFDLLICDLHLPDGSGVDVLLSWPSAALPAAIALTGDQSEELQRRLTDAGFDLVLHKPTPPEALCESAAALLVARKNRGPLEKAAPGRS